MNRNEQRLEMLNKLSIILRELPTSNSIRDISKKTNISTSTIQVYLHNDKLISELLGIEIDSKEYKDFISTLQKWLAKAKKEGPIYGNKVLQERYGNRRK